MTLIWGRASLEGVEKSGGFSTQLLEGLWWKILDHQLGENEIELLMLGSIKRGINSICGQHLLMMDLEILVDYG